MYAGAQECDLKAKLFPSNDTIINPEGERLVFYNQSVNAKSHKFIINNWDYYTDDTVNFYPFEAGLHKVQLVAYNETCTDTVTVFVFNPGKQPENRDGFKAFYGTPEVPQLANSITTLKDGSYILNGHTYISHSPKNYGILMKVKQSGCIEWSRKYNETSPLNENTQVISLSDGGMLLTGGEEYKQYEPSYLMKISTDGSLIWSKSFYQGTSHFYILKIAETQKGELLICGRVRDEQAVYFLKTDANGNVIWKTKIKKRNYLYFDFCNFIEKDQFIYIGGVVNAPEVFTGTDYETVLFKLNIQTGALVWSKKYRNLVNIESGIVVNNEILLTAPLDSLFERNRLTTVLKIDTAGNMIDAKQFLTNTYAGGKSKLLPKSDGGFYIFKYGSFPLNLQPYISYESIFVSVKPDFTPEWFMSYGGAGQSYYSFATVGQNDELVALGDRFGFSIRPYQFSWKLMLQKIDKKGAIDCNFWPDYVTTVPVTIQPDSTLFFVTPSADFRVESNPINFGLAYAENRYVCPQEFLDSCSFIQLAGVKSLCKLGDTITYRIFRNTNCIQPVEWKVSEGVQIVSKNNSEIKVRFHSYNNYKIFASLPYSCIPVLDSVNIEVKPKTQVVLDLGSNTTLCPGNTLKLQADPRFLKYTWQDGTTDSIFIVKEPGSYWVAVVDSCMNLLTDTITISAAPPVPLSLGPDRTKCNNDTLQLEAPAGFLNYSWGPNYNLSNNNSRSVTVNPVVDTLYFVKAEKTPGCFGFDTLQIKVNTSPPIHLGSDVSFCKGDSVVLRAGPGFVSYSWSNGATAQEVSIKTQVTVSVRATTAQGCSSADTLQVLQVFANPVVQLNKDSLLCSQTTRTLDAGSFARYLWNTGAETRTINVAGPGQYRVLVIDNNGCKGADSTVITRMLPLPQRFLGPDTMICSYGTLDLAAPPGFRSYLWNNGSAATKITITQPGIYTLRVTDTYNCSGTDTVLVGLKECLTGFYMPNAFTPDGNGLNDGIAPKLFARVVFYEFSIYNRFGERVFFTRNRTDQWNGLFQNKPQPPGAYAWRCTWQEEGGTKQEERGVLYLVR